MIDAVVDVTEYTPRHWRKTDGGWVLIPGFKVPPDFIGLTVEAMALEIEKRDPSPFPELRQCLAEWRALQSQQEEQFRLMVGRYERVLQREPTARSEETLAKAWAFVSEWAVRIANALPTGELQDEARHYAIQASFRARDGKRAWELSKSWGMTGGW